MKAAEPLSLVDEEGKGEGEGERENKISTRSASQNVHQQKGENWFLGFGIGCTELACDSLDDGPRPIKSRPWRNLRAPRDRGE
jgi:hypothetical protein